MHYLISNNSLADLVRLLAERSDIKSNVKLGGFRSQLQASYVSCHTEGSRYKLNILSMDDNIYAPPWGLSTLAKEFTAAARIIQISSNEVSTLVSGKV